MRDSLNFLAVIYFVIEGFLASLAWGISSRGVLLRFWSDFEIKIFITITVKVTYEKKIDRNIACFRNTRDYI